MKRILIIIGLAALCLFLFYQFAKKNGQKEVEIKHQKEQIQIQNEIIEVKKSVEKRKTVNRQIDTNSNLVWLRQKRCSDCNS